MEIFTEMVALRDEPAFQFGQFSASIVDDDIYSFLRHAEGFPSYLVAINFGVSSKSNLFYDRPEGLVTKMAEVVLHTAGKKGEFAYGTEVNLENYLILHPGEVVVLKLK